VGFLLFRMVSWSGERCAADGAGATGIRGGSARWLRLGRPL
jgi:hypothetical protein